MSSLLLNLTACVRGISAFFVYWCNVNNILTAFVTETLCATEVYKHKCHCRKVYNYVRVFFILDIQPKLQLHSIG